MHLFHDQISRLLTALFTVRGKHAAVHVGDFIGSGQTAVATEDDQEAVKAYAHVLRRDVLDNNALVAGRRANAADGAGTAGRALRILLAGTGLSARFKDGAQWLHQVSYVALALCVELAVGVGSVYAGATSVQSTGAITFDIPAQPLSSALEHYSAASGWQVIYDGSLAAGRISTPIKGLFTPATALQRLLTGTGLVPRYTAADGFFLAPDTAVAARQDSDANTASPFVVEQYYGHIQAGLRRAFCAQDGIRTGGYRVAVSFWMDASGAVSRAALLGSTGNFDLDAKINQTVQGVSVDAPPPAGFAQPVILIVTPALAQYCQAAQGGSNGAQQ